MRQILLVIALLLVLLPAAAGEPATTAPAGKTSLAGPTARALFIGFGSGSRAIGDETGEKIAAWSEGAGLLSGILGVTVLGTDWLVMSFGNSINDPNYTYESSSFGQTGKIMIAAGAAAMITSRIFAAGRVQIWGRMHAQGRRPRVSIGLSAPDRLTLSVNIAKNIR